MAAATREVESAVGAETAYLLGEEDLKLFRVDTPNNRFRPFRATLEGTRGWFNSGPDHIGKLETALYIAGFASLTFLKNLNLI